MPRPSTSIPPRERVLLCHGGRRYVFEADPMAQAVRVPHRSEIDRDIRGLTFRRTDRRDDGLGWPLFARESFQV